MVSKIPQFDLAAWFQTPAAQYIPVSDLSYGPNGVVMPTALPPQSMVFANVTFNKMSNIPSTQEIYGQGRVDRLF